MTRRQTYQLVGATGFLIFMGARAAVRDGLDPYHPLVGLLGDAILPVIAAPVVYWIFGKGFDRLLEKPPQPPSEQSIPSLCLTLH